MKRILTILLLLSFCVAPALAAKYDFTIPATFTESQFNDIVKEAGTVIAYRGVAPAEPGGLTGFDIGVEASFFKIDSTLWDEVIAGDAPTYLPVPRVHLRKGLPFGIDLGASYAMVPSSNIKLIGGELQYAIMDGSTVLPALAVRGHYSTLLGVDDFDLETYGADAVVSKGFLFLTPYVGAGVLRSDGQYTGTDATLKANLRDQRATTPRYFGGVQIAMTLLRLTLEAEYSEFPVYTAKVSLGW